MDVDEWECVSAHLPLPDRRAWAATCRSARLTDRTLWEAQHSYRMHDLVSWAELRYLASVPLTRIAAGAEWLDMSDCATWHHVRDVRLCAIAAIKLTEVARRCRAPVHFHGIDLFFVATNRRASMVRGVMRGERAVVACIAALERNPVVAAFRTSAPPRMRPWVAQLLYSTQTACLAVDALPWGWLCADLFGEE